jgi:hypothetical protein
MTGKAMTQELARLLDKGKTSALHRLPGRTSAATLESLAEAAGWRFLHLDLGKVDSKAEFLRAAGKALDFPDWAGRNWDAFEELVNDLAWLPPAEGYLLLIERASGLAGKEPETLRMALDILADALDARKAGQLPVVALVRGAGDIAVRLPVVEIGKPAGKGGAR